VRPSIFRVSQHWSRLIALISPQKTVSSLGLSHKVRPKQDATSHKNMHETTNKHKKKKQYETKTRTLRPQLDQKRRLSDSRLSETRATYLRLVVPSLAQSHASSSSSLAIVFNLHHQEGYSWNLSNLCPCRLLPNDASWLQISKSK
jgi:hypothetical protein